MTWDLRLGDCLDPATGMASLGDKSVDHVICDPPYSGQVHAGARGAGGKTPGDKLIDFEEMTAEELSLAFTACAGVAKRWLIATVAWEHAAALHGSPPIGLRFVRFGVWVKPNGAPQFTGDRPAQGWEAVAILHTTGGKMRWNCGGDRAVWTQNIEHGEHPTQKPVPLLESFIRLFTDPGDLILDPFAGSGSTGVAAIRLGRRFIGWEKDPKYHEIAFKRLAAAREQMEMAAVTRTTSLRRKAPLRSKRPSTRRSSRVRDAAYLVAVRQLPCAARCLPLHACLGPTEADHMSPDHGLGAKGSDYNAAALCRRAHRQRTDGNGVFCGWTREQMRAWCDARIAETQGALGYPLSWAKRAA